MATPNPQGKVATSRLAAMMSWQQWTDQKPELGGGSSSHVTCDSRQPAKLGLRNTARPHVEVGQVDAGRYGS